MLTPVGGGPEGSMRSLPWVGDWASEVSACSLPQGAGDTQSLRGVHALTPVGGGEWALGVTFLNS